jgi:hypothetical protein
VGREEFVSVIKTRAMKSLSFVWMWLEMGSGGPLGTLFFDFRVNAGEIFERWNVQFSKFIKQQLGDFVTPRQGFFMDPHAFYRAEPPYDSPAMLALPEGEKAIPVGYMLDDGTVVPEGARRIWPYTCQRTQ